MHLPIDDETLDLEKRIADRRAVLQRDGQAAGRRALNGLASPAALVTAVAVGFAAGGGLRRRRRNGRAGGNGHGKANGSGNDAAKKSALASALMTGVTWFIRAQFGSPAGMARAALEKIRSRRNPNPPARPLRVR